VNHLPILPILIPIIGGALSLFVEHRRYGPRVQRSVAWTTMAALAVVVVMLFARTASGEIDVYLLGDWPARLGIVLVADRLSSWMLVTTVLLAAACLLHACAGWDRRAPHFHALFQFQLAGLAGAFLTGDIFNLFVFFEVMLIASYGLLLSGGRGLRMRIGLHYVVFNVTAATFFLIALGLLYATLGSLNMAELAQRIAALPDTHQALAKTTLGLLLLVFCAKAALGPMYLWLPEAYTRAPAAVAALFAIMTKVGLYAVLRVSSLWFGEDAGAFAGFGRDVLLWAGLATLVIAALGVLGATRLRVMISYLVVVSAATLFIAFSIGNTQAVAAGVYYLPHSCFVSAALFLGADLIRRRRGGASDHKDVVAAMPEKSVPAVLFLIAAISIAGLPPLSGFLGKAALLSAVPPQWTGWVWGAVLGSSFLIIIGITRAGIRLFWRVPGDEDEVVVTATKAPARPTETVATLLLIGLGVAMTVFADPLLRLSQATAEQLHDPSNYIEQVRSIPPEIRAP
jgi:multicomponent K+:H+ antiporter subunit D